MAHAYESTQVKRLGFDDEDRKTSRHDLACQYLSDPKKAVAPIASMIRSQIDTIFSRWNDSQSIAHCPSLFAKKAKTEHCLTKGDGKYLTTIGFLDVLFRLNAVMNIYDRNKVNPSNETWPDPVNSETISIALAIEVKASKSSISEAIRQIELYRQFYPEQPVEHCFWLLVTLFPITESERSLLHNANIWHAQLGDDFEDFCLSKSATEKVVSQLIL